MATYKQIDPSLTKQIEHIKRMLSVTTNYNWTSEIT
jgi:hypothetical protein